MIGIKIKKVSKRLCEKRKAFTLMEVLVASSIFAVVLVIVTGTVIQGSGYQVKLKTMAEASEEARRVADKISTDVRDANNKVVFNIESKCNSLNEIEFKSGLSVFYFNGSVTCPVVDTLNLPDNTFGNLMILAIGDKYHVYLSNSNNKKIYYRELDSSTILNTAKIVETVNDIYVVSRGNMLETINFYGYAPYDSYNQKIKQQPMLRFKITVSPDPNLFPDYPPSVIQTGVSVRNYH